MDDLIPARPLEDAAWIEWGVAGAALEGEQESGDRYVVSSFSHGVLVGVVDGLGHGEAAAAAAKVAVATMEKHDSEPLISLVERCHERLLRTRGVVMSVASFDGPSNAMTWLGVGNVEGALYQRTAEPPRERIVPRSGVVGYQLPRLQASVLPVARGDVLVMATDGVKRLPESLAERESPRRIARDILTRFGTRNDDALVLVARYRGKP